MTIHRTANWPLRTDLELGATPKAPGCARVHAKCVLIEWGMPELTDTAELLVSELVTNAMRATRRLAGPIRPPVRLRLTSDRVRFLIEVWDATGEPPVAVAAGEYDENGRGLVLISTLSAKWNWYFPASGGKVVWAELRRAADGVAS